MSKYVYIANNVSLSTVNVAYCDTDEVKKGGQIHIAEPRQYEVVEGEVSLSAATAELSLLEEVLASFAKAGVKGRVGISCHRGLALKIAAKSRDKEIWQSWMETADGDWGGYIGRIEELVSEAKQLGMQLYPIPARALYKAECELGQYEVINAKSIKVGDTEYKDGQDVEFTEVEGDDFIRQAGEGLFVNDTFVVGKRKLEVRVTKRGVAHVTIRRFGYDKASDVLPDTVYGEAVSWFRYVAVPALNSLEHRDGKAPGFAA